MSRYLVALAAALVLGTYYHLAATEHARRVNTQRVRADQSGYLWDAVAIYQGRHGGADTLIGERNRMPVYPWLLSWIYRPSMTPDEFFQVAKAWNIRLSLLLLAALGAIAVRRLPPLAAANFILVVAFGYFVFKAGYAQVELLFYFLFFAMFVASWRLLCAETWRASVGLSTLTGLLAAMSHLSKAALLPYVALLTAILGIRAVAPLITGSGPLAERRRTAAVRAAAPLVLLAVFLAVLSPYLLNSQKQFGHYFYNVNSTFYVWYDDWPSASVGTYKDGDGKGWPTTPRDQIPTWRTYLRDHTTGQIAGRFTRGFAEMVTVSYTRLWYFKFSVMYVLFAAVLIVTAWRPFRALVRAQPFVFAFMALYAVVYSAAVAFYQPISGTSLRMLLVHLAPLLFTVSVLTVTPPFRDVRWTVAGVAVTPIHFHVLMLAAVTFDVVFVLWWRLMADFAGY